MSANSLRIRDVSSIMSAVYPLSVCARVREQVSLELDGELSQLEQRMLAAHLERCAACADRTRPTSETSPSG